MVWLKLMTDFPFVSVENFTYSPAEHETEAGSGTEAWFCLNLEILLK